MYIYMYGQGSQRLGTITINAERDGAAEVYPTSLKLLDEGWVDDLLIPPVGIQGLRMMAQLHSMLLTLGHFWHYAYCCKTSSRGLASKHFKIAVLKHGRQDFVRQHEVMLDLILPLASSIHMHLSHVAQLKNQHALKAV